MILQVANRPAYYLVPSESDGERYYEVNGHTFSCDCPDFQFRKSGTVHWCKHGRALKRYLDAQNACPACGGRGRFIARFSGYASGSDPIPCATCDGTGKRQTADPHLLAVADAYRQQEAAP